MKRSSKTGDTIPENDRERALAEYWYKRGERESRLMERAQKDKRKVEIKVANLDRYTLRWNGERYVRVFLGGKDVTRAVAGIRGFALTSQGAVKIPLNRQDAQYECARLTGAIADLNAVVDMIDP